MLDQRGERQSKWFKFTAGCTGTLEFNINPINAGDDYDWALWNITSDPNNCTTKGNSIACNWSGCNDATGLSSCISSEPGAQNSNGPPCFGAYGAWGTPITVTAGNSYALLIDNFTASNSGFVLTFGGACNSGTAKIGPDANFTYAPSSCGTYNFTKTCATINSSFLWQFGDGSSATTQNASHSYGTSGSYVVTLQVTDALGCITTFSQTITISTATAPAATTPQSFCSSTNPTVASLTATGTALQWYSAATGGSPLASTTALPRKLIMYRRQWVDVRVQELL
jgi:PKD repeat protein